MVTERYLLERQQSRDQVEIQGREVSQEGTGSFTSTAMAINTMRKTLLCQGQSGFPHLLLHLHLLSRSLPQAEGRGEHSHIKQSMAEPVLLWHSFSEALQSPWLHTVLAQTPLEGLLRERGTAELLTYFSGCFSSAFQLLLELWRFTALQLVMRCLVAFHVC